MWHVGMCNHFVVFQNALQAILKVFFLKAWEEGVSPFVEDSNRI